MCRIEYNVFLNILVLIRRLKVLLDTSQQANGSGETHTRVWASDQKPIRPLWKELAWVFCRRVELVSFIFSITAHLSPYSPPQDFLLPIKNFITRKELTQVLPHLRTLLCSFSPKRTFSVAASYSLMQPNQILIIFIFAFSFPPCPAKYISHGHSDTTPDV